MEEIVPASCCAGLVYRLVLVPLFLPHTGDATRSSHRWLRGFACEPVWARVEGAGRGQAETG